MTLDVLLVGSGVMLIIFSMVVWPLIQVGLENGGIR